MKPLEKDYTMSKIYNYDSTIHLYYNHNGVIESLPIIDGEHKDYKPITLTFEEYEGGSYNDMFVSEPIGLYNAVVSMVLSKHRRSMLPNGKKLDTIDLNEVISDCYTRLMSLGDETTVIVDDKASQYIYTICAQVYEIYNYQARRALLTQSDALNTVYNTKGFEINTIDGLERLAIQEHERQEAIKARKDLDYQINDYILDIIKYISQKRTYESMKEVIYSYANGIPLTDAQRSQLVRQRRKVKKMMLDNNIDNPKDLLMMIIDNIKDEKKSTL